MILSHSPVHEPSHKVAQIACAHHHRRAGFQRNQRLGGAVEMFVPMRDRPAACDLAQMFGWPTFDVADGDVKLRKGWRQGRVDVSDVSVHTTDLGV